MLQTVLYMLIALSIPPIFMVGCRMLHVKRENGLKILAVALLAVEAFRMFYTASLFEGGAAAANSLSFSLLSLIAVGAMLGAFGKGRLGGYAGAVTAACCLSPLVLAAINPAVYTLAGDTHAMLTGLYFCNAGLALTFTVVRLVAAQTTEAAVPLAATQKSSVFVPLTAAAAMYAVLLLTVLTNYMWDASYLFTDKLYQNILIWVLSPLSAGLVYLAQVILFKIRTKEKRAAAKPVASQSDACEYEANEGGRF